MKVYTRFLFLLCVTITMIGCGLNGARPALAASSSNDQIFKLVSTSEVKASIDVLTAYVVNNQPSPPRIPLSFIPAPKQLSEAVNSYQKAHSIAKLPVCSSLHSLRIELDNQATTQEWLVARGKNCAPLPKDESAFWVVQQQTGTKPNVLIADKADLVEVLVNNLASPKSRAIRMTRQGKPCPNCSSVICTRGWFNKTGSYRGGAYTVEEFRKDYGYEQVSLDAEKCPLD
ncbi:MAG: hypothetical protein WBP46_08270 [Thiolinea sp.]